MKGKSEGRERNIDVRESLMGFIPMYLDLGLALGLGSFASGTGVRLQARHVPQPGIKPATLRSGVDIQQLSRTGQGHIDFFFYPCAHIGKRFLCLPIYPFTCLLM